MRITMLRMLVPVLLEQRLRDTFHLGETGNERVPSRGDIHSSLSTLHHEACTCLLEVFIAQQSGGNSQRNHRLLQMRAACRVIRYLSMQHTQTSAARRVARGTQDMCTTAALIRTRQLGGSATSTVFGYIGTSHHRTRTRERKGHP